METLGLAGAKAQEDGFLRRLLWPTISNQYDVDILGRRGFWLTLVVGLVSCFGLALQGSWLVGMLVLIVFSLGAAGIRERSVAASALVLTVYALSIVSSWTFALLGYGVVGNPFISIVLIMLLCANLRATVISQQWLMSGLDSDFPKREDTGILDAVVNRFPRSCWPKGRYVFFVVAPLYLLLSLAGFAVVALKGKPVQTQPHAPQVHVRVVPGS